MKKGETMPAGHRAKIAAALADKPRRPLTKKHRRAIGRGVTRYWALRERSGTS
jgi:hypothetical protein